MEQIERCPACSARLGNLPVCARCGTDFSISRRAERQALRLTRVAVRALALGQTSQAAIAAQAASSLASSLLARAVAQTIRRRQA